MSGYSNEQIEAVAAAAVASVEAIITDTVFDQVDGPLTAEPKKLYIVSSTGSRTQNKVITLPDALTLPAGWACEVISALSERYRIEMVLANQTSNLWLGNGAPDDRPDLPVPMDMAQQHYRFMATGPLVIPGFGTIGGWIVSRMNVPFLAETRLVHRATTAALPSYTEFGDQSQHELRGASGSLNVDGVLSIPDSVMVKNEAGGLAPNNGIYQLIQTSPWILRRRSDFCFQNQLIYGCNVVVTGGAINVGRRFHLDAGTHDVDVSDITFGISGDAAGAPDLVPIALQTDEYAGSVRERVPYTPASFTGTKRITFPVSPSNGDKFGINNVTSSTAIINVYAAAEKIQDPITGAVILTAATDIPIGLAYAGYVWQYMASVTGNAWHLVGG
jgi:hypothetical protein